MHYFLHGSINSTCLYIVSEHEHFGLNLDVLQYCELPNNVKVCLYFLRRDPDEG